MSTAVAAKAAPKPIQSKMVSAVAAKPGRTKSSGEGEYQVKYDMIKKTINK